MTDPLQPVPFELFANLRMGFRRCCLWQHRPTWRQPLAACASWTCWTRPTRWRPAAWPGRKATPPGWRWRRPSLSRRPKNGLRVVNGADPAHPLQSGLLVHSGRLSIGGHRARIMRTWPQVTMACTSWISATHPNQLRGGAYPIDGILCYVETGRRQVVRRYIWPQSTPGVSMCWMSAIQRIRSRSVMAQWCGECHGIDVVGNIGYFADTNGVRIVDFSDPVAPTTNQRHA